MAKKPSSSAKSDAPVIGPAVGDKAPAFALPDQSGKAHSLADYRGRWLVLYFYPKDDTSGCTKEACSFRDESRVFAKKNAAVLGVSPDDVKSHDKFARKYSLPFPLLADPEKSLLQAYGVWQEKSMYGRKYMGVVRTTVLIGPAGKIARRWDKVSVDGHTAEVLAALDELGAK